MAGRKQVVANCDRPLRAATLPGEAMAPGRTSIVAQPRRRQAGRAGNRRGASAGPSFAAWLSALSVTRSCLRAANLKPPNLAHRTRTFTTLCAIAGTAQNRCENKGKASLVCASLSLNSASLTPMTRFAAGFAADFQAQAFAGVTLCFSPTWIADFFAPFHRIGRGALLSFRAPALCRGFLGKGCMASDENRKTLPLCA